MKRVANRLEAVQRLREARQQRAEQEVGDCREALERAEAELGRVRERCLEHQRARRALVELERVPTEGRRALELQRQAAYAGRLAEESRELGEALERAERARNRKQKRLERAQQELQEAIGKRKAVQTRRRRAEAEQSKREELRAEMEAEEVFAARRGKR